MTLSEQFSELKEMITSFFNPKKRTKDVSQNKTENKMKVKDYVGINAALKVEEMEAAENGSVTLTADQMKELNTHIAGLNETIENLKKADGDGSSRTEGDEGGENSDMPGTLANEMYKNLFEND